MEKIIKGVIDAALRGLSPAVVKTEERHCDATGHACHGGGGLGGGSLLSQGNFKHIFREAGLDMTAPAGGI